MTSFSDDFNRADSTNLGAGWVEVSGDWSIISSQLSSGNAGGTIILRAATAMATADHSVQMTIAATAAVSHGVWARGNANITSGYLLRNDGTSWNIFSVIGGSFTSIGSYAAAAAAGDVVKLQVVGTAIKGYVNGVLRISVTDSGVTSGTSVGIRAESTSSLRFDDFAAADVTAGATLPITSTVETAQTLTGAKAAANAVAVEVDSARPLTGAKAAALPPAGEVGTPLALAGTKTATLTPAGETATAQNLTGAKTAAPAPAGEVTTTQALAGSKAGAIAPGAEAAIAQPLAGAKTTALAIAASVASAQPFTGTKTAALAPAVEVDAAQVLTATESEAGLLDTAGTVETALPLSATKTATLTPALEVDAARPVTRQLSITPSPERTYKIPAERRRLTVPAEDRRLVVAAESRTLTVRR